MKFRLYALIVLLGSAIAAGASCCRAQSLAAADARILTLTCKAQLIKAGTAAKIPLSSPTDVGRGLSAGDQIQCVGPGYLEVLIPDGPKKFSASFTIRPVSSTPKYPDIAKDLHNFGIRGATRGIATSSGIMWPSENSTVIPEHFAIRWTPVAHEILLSIMSESKDVTLWGPKKIDGGTGLLKSDELSSILAAYKAKSENTRLVLILAPTSGTGWEEAHFSLLKGRTELDLNAQLEFWKEHTSGLALRLGRGYSFSRSSLFAEAADEYDSALKSAPDSRYLLEEAIQANRLAGRTDRVKDLQMRLASRPEAIDQEPAPGR